MAKARIKYNAVITTPKGVIHRLGKPCTAPEAMRRLKRVENLRQYKGSRMCVAQSLTFDKGN